MPISNQHYRIWGSRAVRNLPSAWLVLGMLGAALLSRATDKFAAPPSDPFIHDPSTIYKDGDRYHVFGTGFGIVSKSSTDLVKWNPGLMVFYRTVPAWTARVVPEFRAYIWAPDLIRVHNRYLLYYSVSTFGKQTSAIGLATNATLDENSLKHRWEDGGLVLQSTNGSPFNAIDPSVLLDADGKLWMAFGSFWQGIHLVELNPQTGLRLSPSSPIHRLAFHDSIEAACLVRHGEFYYLFVNWGTCCRGLNSTYEVRVGRSRRVTGPYLDAEGKDMVQGGGTPFLSSEGRYHGPGHIGLLRDGDQEWVSYHFYDREVNGRSRLDLRKLDWNFLGWPVVGEHRAPPGPERPGAQNPRR